eukprot:scaffold93368_cov15-Tisochrysis_lutea.AAC.1
MGLSLPACTAAADGPGAYERMLVHGEIGMWQGRPQAGHHTWFPGHTLHDHKHNPCASAIHSRSHSAGATMIPPRAVRNAGISFESQTRLSSGWGSAVFMGRAQTLRVQALTVTDCNLKGMHRHGGLQKLSCSEPPFLPPRGRHGQRWMGPCVRTAPCHPQTPACHPAKAERKKRTEFSISLRSDGSHSAMQLGMKASCPCTACARYSKVCIEGQGAKP